MPNMYNNRASLLQKQISMTQRRCAHRADEIATNQDCIDDDGDEKLWLVIVKSMRRRQRELHAEQYADKKLLKELHRQAAFARVGEKVMREIDYPEFSNGWVEVDYVNFPRMALP